MFKRGFKTWCEEVSESFRGALKLSKVDPLSPFDLAGHLKVRLRTPNDFLALDYDVRSRLLSKHNDCWSAFTISTGKSPLVVYNPGHSDRRVASDLMHELAHLVLGHTASKMFISSMGFAVRSHDQQQEEEATWLSGCLLLPRIALLSIKSRRLTFEQAAKHYGVSIDMLRYRLQVTGVNKMFSRI